MLELVGASEAADLLDVEVQRISRLQKQGRMPRPVAHLASTPVWAKEDILSLKEGRRGAVLPMPLLGTSEAAEALSVNKSQIGRWLRTGDFPAPTVRLAAGPVWTRQQIEDFRASRL